MENMTNTQQKAKGRQKQSTFNKREERKRKKEAGLVRYGGWCKPEHKETLKHCEMALKGEYEGLHIIYGVSEEAYQKRLREIRDEKSGCK